eukprot:863959-Pelagomonas_calceolata.AAC.3
MAGRPSEVAASELSVSTLAAAPCAPAAAAVGAMAAAEASGVAPCPTPWMSTSLASHPAASLASSTTRRIKPSRASTLQGPAALCVKRRGPLPGAGVVVGAVAGAVWEGGLAAAAAAATGEDGGAHAVAWLEGDPC